MCVHSSRFACMPNATASKAHWVKAIDGPLPLPLLLSRVHYYTRSDQCALPSGSDRWFHVCVNVCMSTLLSLCGVPLDLGTWPFSCSHTPLQGRAAVEASQLYGMGHLRIARPTGYSCIELACKPRLDRIDKTRFKRRTRPPSPGATRERNFNYEHSLLRAWVLALPLNETTFCPSSVPVRTESVELDELCAAEVRKAEVRGGQ